MRWGRRLQWRRRRAPPQERRHSYHDHHHDDGEKCRDPRAEPRKGDHACVLVCVRVCECVCVCVSTYVCARAVCVFVVLDWDCPSVLDSNISSRLCAEGRDYQVPVDWFVDWLLRFVLLSICFCLSLSLFLSHFVFSWSPFPLGSPILFLFLFPFPGPDRTLKYCQSAIRCSSVNSLEPLPFSSPFHVLCPFSFGGEVSLMSSIRHWPWLLIRVSSSLEKRSIWNSHERMQAANNQVNPVW